MVGAVRFTARILTILGTGLVLYLVIGRALSEEGSLSPLRQSFSVSVGVIGMFLWSCGVVLARKWEIRGGILAVAGMAIFQVVEGKLWMGPLFAGLQFVGILLILCGILQPRTR